MTESIEPRDVLPTDPATQEDPIPAPLIVFGGDDELVCVDDTCAPVAAPK